MHFFIAQLCFAENLRLQLELHELLHAPALHEHLRSFLINRDAEPVLLRKKKRVFLWRKFEPEFFEQSPQLCDLFLRERMRVGIQRPMLNAQRSTLNRFVIPSGVRNGGLGEAATWIGRPQAKRTGNERTNVCNI